MIIFKPETDEAILKDHEGSTIYNAFENEELVGRAFFRTDMLYCDVYKLEYPVNRLYVAQGLLRACYNYGVSCNAYMGKLSDKSCDEVGKSMNFIFDGTSYVNDIPTLLMGSCCCEEEI